MRRFLHLLVATILVGVAIPAVPTLLMHGASSQYATTGFLDVTRAPCTATGNGVTDDTAAIQACIDYAVAHNIQGVFCPDGNYVISGAGNAILYLDPPNNARSNWSAPPLSNFSLAFVGEDFGLGNHEGYGCRLRPTTDSNVALAVGPGQRMHVSGISIHPSAWGYRTDQPQNGVGIGILGANAGASNTLIENVWIEDYQVGIGTDANAACCLSDSNTFNKVYVTNAGCGIQVAGTQAFINHVIDPTIKATNAICSPLGRAVRVDGGDLSATNGVSNAFTISSVSAVSAAAIGNWYNLTFTATVASPDSYVNTVYNSYDIVTAHFGVIPLTLTSYNSGTGVGTFTVWFDWTVSNYSGMNLATATDFSAEVQAVTTLYAAERITVANGSSITLNGVHIENPSACQTLVHAYAGFGGAMGNRVNDVYFNSDPGLTSSAPANSPNAASLANFYCQETFPFIYSDAGATGNILVSGGQFGQISSSSPVLIELDVHSGNHDTVKISDVTKNTLESPNIRLFSNLAMNITGNYYDLDSNGHGSGQYSNDLFQSRSAANSNGFSYTVFGETSGPYCGWRPCPWTEPSLPPAEYALVSSTLGALGSYPLINCETIYRSVEWNSATLTNTHLRSASCPGFSYGQNLTDALVGGTVKWAYKGQSNVLYLDAKTLGWMFAGLGFSLDNGGGPVSYIVTGVYPDLSAGAPTGTVGYVTVLNATTDSIGLSGPTGLVGTKTTVYSCASSCTIGQAAYSWTAYP